MLILITYRLPVYSTNRMECQLLLSYHHRYCVGFRYITIITKIQLNKIQLVPNKLHALGMKFNNIYLYLSIQ